MEAREENKGVIVKVEDIKVEDFETQPRKLKPRADFVAGIIAVILSLFQLYTSWRGPFDIFVQRPIHIGLAFILLFSIYPPKKRSSSKDKIHWVDWILIVATLACIIWVIVSAVRFTENLGESIPIDLVFGSIMILMVLEAARRVLGPILPLIALSTILYALFGPQLPGLLSHPGFSFRTVIEQLYTSNIGIWGLVVGISATIIPGFLIFGVMLEKTGGGETFVDLAMRIAGKSHGGAGKVSCFSSAFFGTISGSAVANVVVDGVFNIPLMKSLKFKPELAAAVEATTSTGGQIMPPVMGAGAFIIAEILGIQYTRVAAAAAIPAILYYLGCYCAIHFEAQRLKLKPVPSEMIPSFLHKILPRSLPFFLPVAVLVYLMSTGYSPSLSVLWSIVISVGFHVITARSRETLKRRVKEIISALNVGGKTVVMVASLCACAQIVVTMFGVTGVGVKISQIVLDLSRGNMLLTLFFAMIICLILGMGVPTSAAYVIAASVSVPALTLLGGNPLSAHLFIFYFAILSSITPPVCPAVYVASAIARSNWWKTGWISVRLGLAGFVIPYMFFYAPGLLLIGDPLKIIINSVTASLGVVAMAAGLMGFFIKPLSWVEIPLLLLAGGLLIDPGFMTDIIGLVILGTVYMNQKKSFLPFLSIHGRQLQE